MTTTTPRRRTRTTPPTALQAYAEVQCTLRVLLTEVGRMVDALCRPAVPDTVGQVVYLEGIAQGLQRILDDYNDV